MKKHKKATRHHHSTKSHPRHKVQDEAKQSSFPTTLLIVVIGLIILALIVLLSEQPQQQVQPSEIIEAISSTDDGFVRQETLDSLALMDFDNKYSDIKQENGIQGDFYVYFEDENGKVIQVEGKTCFGSPMAADIDPRCG